MQYVGRAIGSVSKTWSSINPSTLSGAIDVVVVEHPDGRLACSPFHVRFGKFQILKPSQKKVLVSVNGQPTNIPMKLGDSGEAYFVFETEADVDAIPDELISSPVVSATSSPSATPNDTESNIAPLEEPDFLDIGKPVQVDTLMPSTPPPPRRHSIFEERARKLNQKLHEKKIPSKFDNNGDLLLDIEGYKPSTDKVHDTDAMLKQLLQDELGTDFDISSFVREDRSGNMRIVNPGDDASFISPPGSPTPQPSDVPDIPSSCPSETSTQTSITTSTDYTPPSSSRAPDSAVAPKNYIKTIRLTSEQLRCLDLRYGENDLSFSVDNSRAVITAKLFLWRWDVPLVISDIDGTITKSDALGHVLTMIGRDWTHLGVAELFTEIKRNGYNVVYLTARSAGQADSTRSYLNSIAQDGFKLPRGPVILSPDRTMAALRREVILKKPEVFKIACLNDLRRLYYGEVELSKLNDDTRRDDFPTPFVAGFGNRITDALAYRTVGIPSSRIFTINPDGEVHMELLELAGYRSSYIHINELVDHFFPPVATNYSNGGDDCRNLSPTPGSPPGTVVEGRSFHRPRDVQFTDVNFWREPILDLDDLSDLDSVAAEEADASERPTNFSEPFSDAKSSKSTSYETNSPSTPNSPLQGYKTTGNPKTAGKQFYLELGSPLASPKLNYMDTAHGVKQQLKTLNISKPTEPSTEVSAFHVLNDRRAKNAGPEPSKEVLEEASQEAFAGMKAHPETTDDEFDEDEFDEDDEEDDDDDDDEDYEPYQIDESGDSEEQDFDLDLGLDEEESDEMHPNEEINEHENTMAQERTQEPQNDTKTTITAGTGY
ncbi:LAME_0E04940g1_1 [Lachancea meyersii CBS 8951]|uniref:LAME_0E04940g1_1 n=1 Tax=Lachancea meyersii CBS 8951 TaxID=1266667 RepID=A0A1G4JH96_9SACH|nr:LAME_0E04940g1_1 [Lachancea meyersii CBS 8951]